MILHYKQNYTRCLHKMQTVAGVIRVNYCYIGLVVTQTWNYQILGQIFGLLSYFILPII